MEGKELIGGPSLSAGERGEGRRSGRLGLGPGEEKEGARGWALKAERRRGRREERFSSFFYFSKTIFKLIFQMEFEFKTLLFKPTHHKNKMHQHVCNIKCYSKLILILIPQNIYFSYISMLTKIN